MVCEFTRGRDYIEGKNLTTRGVNGYCGSLARENSCIKAITGFACLASGNEKRPPTVGLGDRLIRSGPPQLGVHFTPGDLDSG